MARMRPSLPTLAARLTVTAAFVGALASCGTSTASTATTSASTESSVPVATVAATATTSSSSTSTASTSSASLADVLRAAHWASNVTVTPSDGSLTYVSDGLPNHSRQVEYALPNTGVRVPTAATAHAGADPTTAQSYSFTITTNPQKAATTTSTSLGTIGIMISGAALFNPYEGDASTVALASNFTVKDSAGNDVAFLDSCNGHPTPSGVYHYHGLPSCVTAQVDTASGPSHIIGVAFDGFPIYGDRAIDGTPVTAAQLDACNGITSATPEFPSGMYHYVLLPTADSTSSIKCFSGTVDSSLTTMARMP